MGSPEPLTLNTTLLRARPRIARDLLPTTVDRRTPLALYRTAGMHVRRAVAHTLTPPRNRRHLRRDIPRRRQPRSGRPALSWPHHAAFVGMLGARAAVVRRGFGTHVKESEGRDVGAGSMGGGDGWEERREDAQCI